MGAALLLQEGRTDHKKTQTHTQVLLQYCCRKTPSALSGFDRSAVSGEPGGGEGGMEIKTHLVAVKISQREAARKMFPAQNHKYRLVGVDASRSISSSTLVAFIASLLLSEGKLMRQRHTALLTTKALQRWGLQTVICPAFQGRPYLPGRCPVLEVYWHSSLCPREHAADALSKAGERVEGSRQGVGLGPRGRRSESSPPRPGAFIV